MKSNYDPVTGRSPDDSRDDWKTGFQIGTGSGMTCQICRCLVRQSPGDAKAHLAWHEANDGR